MKQKLYVLLSLLVLSMLVLTACGGAQPAASEEKQQEVTIPAEYKGKTNPLAGKEEAAAAGKEIFDANCASCHGEKGLGDGPAAASLDPKPPKLAEEAKTASDDLLFYRIAEGRAGGPPNSAMPAWKGVLSEEEMWQVITYIRKLAEK